MLRVQPIFHAPRVSRLSAFASPSHLPSSALLSYPRSRRTSPLSRSAPSRPTSRSLPRSRPRHSVAESAAIPSGLPIRLLSGGSSGLGSGGGGYRPSGSMVTLEKGANHFRRSQSGRAGVTKLDYSRIEATPMTQSQITRKRSSASRNGGIKKKTSVVPLR